MKNFLYAASLLVLSASLAFAQSTPSAENLPHSPILPVKIKPKAEGADGMSKVAADIEKEKEINPESVGLALKPTDTPLNAQLWQDQTRAEIAAEINALNTNISSPELYRLTKQALAIAPDTTSFSGSADKSGIDTLSSRLKKLTELGAYDEALKIYKMLDGNIPSSDAALAGTQALVGTGQMGLACLEDKALDDTLQKSGDAFWNDLSSLCQNLLSAEGADDTADAFTKIAQSPSLVQKFPSVTKTSELNEKSILHVLVLAKSNRLPLISAPSARELKPAVLSLLLSQPTLKSSQQISLLVAGVEKGLRSQEDLDAEYKRHADVMTTIETPADLGDWQPLLSAYGKMKSLAQSEAKAQELKKLLANPNYSQTALLPFASDLGSINTQASFSDQERKQIAGILALAAQPQYLTWLDSSKALENQNISQDPKDLSKSEAAAGSNDESSLTSTQPSENIGISVAEEFAKLQEKPENGVPLSYDNLLSLTPSGNYVMPSDELKDDLRKSASNGQTGKMILTALQILDGKRLSEIHPAALYQILQAFETMGMSEESSGLAREALADFIKK